MAAVVPDSDSSGPGAALPDPPPVNSIPTIRTQPGLERDKLKSKSTPEDFKFSLEIISTCYLLADKQNKCAVVLGATFILSKESDGGGEAGKILFQSSRVPLRVQTDQADVELHQIDPYPDGGAEIVEISRGAEVKGTVLQPNFNVSAGGATLAFGGVGSYTHTADHKSRVISLRSERRQKMASDNSPPPANWIFNNRFKEFYPATVRFMFVVDGTPPPGQDWFEFKVHLMPELSVDVVDRTYRRFVPRLRQSKPDGWHFRIRGNFKPNIALEAYNAYVENPVDGGIFAKIGLRAATLPYLKSQGLTDPALIELLKGREPVKETAPPVLLDPDPIEYVAT